MTCRPAGGLGAPIGSPHASFMGLSEAIFQNWLHLRTCEGPTFSGGSWRGAPWGLSAPEEGGAVRRLWGEEGAPSRPGLHPPDLALPAVGL